MCASACVRVMCPHFRSRSRCVYVSMYVCVDDNTGNMMLKEHKLHHCQNDLIFKTQNFAVCLSLWLCVLVIYILSRIYICIYIYIYIYRYSHIFLCTSRRRILR